MKKAALIASLLLSLACSHRKAVVVPVELPATSAVVYPAPFPLPPVTSEPPSAELVVAPPVLPVAAPREASGRFLQRIAYRTKVREAVKRGDPVPGLTGVSGQESGHHVQIPVQIPQSRQEPRQTVAIPPAKPSSDPYRDNPFMAFGFIIAAIVAVTVDILLTRRK
jgi:hypothetical protein